MADTVKVITIFEDDINLVVKLTGVSDGTGEANVKKVDITTVIVNEYGKQPSGFNLEQLRWAIQGYTNINLIFDRTATPATVAVLCASGYDDYRGLQRGTRNMQRLAGLADPNMAAGDGKGSLLLTSVGAVAGATYDITVWLSKYQNNS